MISSEMQEERIARLRLHFAEHHVDALLVRNLEEGRNANIRYLAGFTGSHGNCLVTLERALFLTDNRYALQAQEEASAWERCILSGDMTLSAQIKALSVRRLGLIAPHVSWDFVRRMQEALGSEIEIVPLPDIVHDHMRGVKHKEEVAHIRAAIRAMEQALERIYILVRPGMTEREIAQELEYDLPDGAKIAFDSIIASGVRSAMPHGVASAKVIEQGDIIQFDVGCRVNGYVSDISRVAVMGKATREQKRMHRTLLAAIDAALALYRPGMQTREACKKANAVLVRRGYPAIPHGLGHGIGLDVHEGPGVSDRAPDEEIFQAGQVVTVEPGIYLEGYGGMRIEEDVLITDTGNEVLTKFPTKLQEL